MRNRSLWSFGLLIVLVVMALNGCNDASLQSIQPSALGIGFSAEGTLEVGELIANGYRSLGFPVGTSTLTVQGANTEFPVSLAVVNNSTETKTVTVAADFSSVQTNLKASSDNVLTDSSRRSEGFWHHDLNVSELDRVFRLGNYQPLKPSARANIRADVVGDEKSFYVHSVLRPSVCVQSIAHPVGSGQTYFYVEKAISDTRISQFVSDLVLKWPSIYQKNRATFGDDFVGTLNGATYTEDVTILILTPSSIDPGGIGIVGYFSEADFDSSSVYSNKRKIFYVRFYPENSLMIQSTLAHEYAHLIYYSQKGAVSRLTTSSSDSHFETEAMAGYAEHVNGFGVPNQSADLTGKTQSFLAYHDKYRLDEWDYSAGTDLSEYGKAYLFGTWFAQKYGVSGSLKSLVAYPAVGRDSFEGYSRKTFSELQAAFSLALFINDYNGPSLYGFQDINLNGTYGPENGKITLTGPKSESYSLTTSKSLTLQPYTSQFLNFYTSGPVTFTLPTEVSVYELHR